MNYTDVIARVPPGKVGVAELVHDTPSELTRLRAAIQGQPLGREKYARLLIRGRLYMTDAEFEWRTNSEPVMRARGDVLIAGLGIGLILDPIIEKAATVTVVEHEADVISLVAPHFPTVKVVHADIFKWEPEKGAKWDMIYFDIWPNISEDDLDEAKALRKRYRKFLRKGGWMGSWTAYANAVVHRTRR